MKNELSGFLAEVEKDASFLRGLVGRIKSVATPAAAKAKDMAPSKRQVLKATAKTKAFLKEDISVGQGLATGAVGILAGSQYQKRKKND